MFVVCLLIPRAVGAYNTNQRFTGKPLDPVSNLYYFNQRHYNAEIGKFIQPDPLRNFLVTPDLTKRTGLKLEDVLSNPQRLNEYSYSLNNPVNVIDPTGESPVVSKNRQERFDKISDYIRNNENYWLVRDRDGNASALDLIWQKSLDLSKNDKGVANLNRALDTFFDAVNINWRDDKTLDKSREDYLSRLNNLPNALIGEYGGNLSMVDKLQHFAGAARLSQKLGGRIAMMLGRLKEIHDGFRALFNHSQGGYFQLKQRDEGYSRGDMAANQLGVFWLNEFKTGQIGPSIVINNW